MNKIHQLPLLPEIPSKLPLAAPTERVIDGLSSAVVGSWVHFGGAYHALQFRGRLGLTAFCGRIAGHEEVALLREPWLQPRKVCPVCLGRIPDLPPEARKAWE
jgi:hypothetical protein